MVFRPSESEFPPARGRMSIELLPGGQLEYAGPGPDDRRISRTGTWTLHGQEIALKVPGRTEERYQIESVDEHRLVLRRKE